MRRSTQWLSRDPIAENGGINLYAYVGNDPINAMDPLGLYPGEFIVDYWHDANCEPIKRNARWKHYFRY